MDRLSGLSPRQIRRFASALDRLYGEEPDVDGYAHLSCEVLKTALDADGCTYSERDWAQTGLGSRPMDGCRVLWSEPCDGFPAIAERIWMLCEGGPAWLARPDGVVQLLSDFFSPPRLRDHAVYQEGLRALRIFHNLNFAIHAHRTIDVQFGVCRDGTRDFDDGDRLLAAALAPHLKRAYGLAVQRRWLSLDVATAVDHADLDLTERQQAVLRWVAAGKSNEAIGEILGISPETVKVHLRRIYDRLGVGTRVGAMSKALDAVPGFLPVGGAVELGWSDSAPAAIGMEACRPVVESIWPSVAS